MAFPVPLDRVTSLGVDPGAPFVVRGLVTAAVDGSSFDPLFQWDGLAASAWHSGGLFDLTAGGLRVVEQHPDRHEYILASTGGVGAGCAAAGVRSPCLVPRVATLAHERLRTGQELLAGLSGSLIVEAAEVSPPAGESGHQSMSELAIGGPGLLLALALSAVFWARRRAQTALGRVRSAARAAMRVARADVTLKPVRTHIRGMVLQAIALDAARRACARKLCALDIGALERKREAHARASSGSSSEALAWIAAECDEAERLRADLESSVTGIERIESALRVMSLRMREHYGTRVRATRDDPVDAAAAELAYRDQAREEIERASDP